MYIFALLYLALAHVARSLCSFIISLQTHLVSFDIVYYYSPTLQYWLLCRPGAFFILDGFVRYYICSYSHETFKRDVATLDVR